LTYWRWSNINELMGLPEDNLAKPDIDGAEIKTHSKKVPIIVICLCFF